LIPLVPCLLVGAVEGLAAVLAGLGGLRRPRGLAAAAVLAVSLPYPVYALATGRAEAQRRTNVVFDSACKFMTHQDLRPGPVLTRHPGEVYWQTGRRALAPAGDDPEGVARLVDRWGVAYLLVDEERYANAPANPLAGFVREFRGRTRLVWEGDDGRSSVRVFEVRPQRAGPSNRSTP
jgi:hypothetical protein